MQTSAMVSCAGESESQTMQTKKQMATQTKKQQTSADFHMSGNKTIFEPGRNWWSETSKAIIRQSHCPDFVSSNTWCTFKSTPCSPGA
jgi:hypothetical protein